MDFIGHREWGLTPWLSVQTEDAYVFPVVPGAIPGVKSPGLEGSSR